MSAGQSSTSRQPIRFGIYEVDPNAGELRKNGVKLKLQGQPFQVLVTLLQQHGQLVAREELRKRVWPGHTFVDFDQGLNTAIAKIREVLGDSASNPRFVETVPRRGYRFIAPVETPEPIVLPVTPTPMEREPARKPWWQDPRVAALLLLALAAGLLISPWVRGPAPPAEMPPRHFTVTPEEPVWCARISPDGKQIAYVAGSPTRALWIHNLGRGQARKIDGTDGALPLQPFWSPESSFIAFTAGNELKTVAVADNSLTVVCQLLGPIGRVYSGTWSRDAGSIVFAHVFPNGLYQVPARGGNPKELIGPKTKVGWATPKLLPPPVTDRAVLCAFGSNREPDIVVQNLETGERVQVVPGSSPAYSPTGHVLYEALPRGSRLINAIPFSLEQLSAAGDPFPVARNAWQPSLAADGTLVYLGGPVPLRQHVWLDRSGNKLGEIGQPEESFGPSRLSPDGRYLAVGQNSDIWVHDIQRSIKMLLTPSNPGSDGYPVWSPDGDYIAYGAARPGSVRDIVLRRADGTGEPETLIGAQVGGLPRDWSRDGKYLLYQAGGNNIYYLRRTEDGSFSEPIAYLASPSWERVPQFSPDSRYVAYCSDESGRDEVYVQRFPEGGDRVQVSRDGGTQPRWSGDGRELFYVEGDTLMTVPVRLSPGFSAGTPKPLFRHPGLLSNMPEQHYNVSGNGQRFVVSEALASKDASPAIHVVQNWFAQFRGSQR